MPRVGNSPPSDGRQHRTWRCKAFADAVRDLQRRFATLRDLDGPMPVQPCARHGGRPWYLPPAFPSRFGAMTEPADVAIEGASVSVQLADGRVILADVVVEPAAGRPFIVRPWGYPRLVRIDPRRVVGLGVVPAHNYQQWAAVVQAQRRAGFVARIEVDR